ncbi:MAG: TolC family protein [Methylococcales bacterium]|nr:TolC family protein [Methylococcales bacterium]
MHYFNLSKEFRLPILLFCFYCQSIVLAETQQIHHLSLQQAEKIALMDDPLMNQFQYQSSRFEAQSIFAKTLPDPNLKLGIIGLPIDDFDRSKEAMTQLQIGLQQSFPAGKILEKKSLKNRVMSTLQLQKKSHQTLLILKKVRQHYIEIYFHQKASQVISESQKTFKQLVNITEAHFASGKRNQQDVLRAELELLKITDRSIKNKGRIDQARVNLGKWIGDKALWSLQKSPPVLPRLHSSDKTLEALINHSVIIIEDQKIKAQDVAVDIAIEKFKPRWMLDVTYGERNSRNTNGSKRPELLSVMMNVSLPIHHHKKQGAWLSSEKSKLQANRYQRIDKIRELKRQFNLQLTLWESLKKRQYLFDQQMTQQAQLNVEAAMIAYQSSVSDFDTLIKSELIRLKIRLQAIKIKLELTKSHAKLLYFQGE